MARGGENRGRLLLIILVITSLFLITLDLRGVSLISGLRTGTQSALSPVQSVGATILSPVRNFFVDVIYLGRTRSEMEKLRTENGELLSQLRERRGIDAQLERILPQQVSNRQQRQRQYSRFCCNQNQKKK